MKVIEANRDAIYSILNAIFEQLNRQITIAEVGVLKGNNALAMYQALSPRKMLLIDAWSVDESIKEFRANNNHRCWVDDPSKYDFYVGGPVDEQTTFDNLYAETKSKFKNIQNVELIRADSTKAYQSIKEKYSKKIEFIYLDASHQYEKVLDDLLNYKDLLDEDLGCFQLNDCCHSKAGVRQNLGVLEAANKFCKMADFVPILAVNRDFTDVLLAPAKSPMINNVNIMVEHNDIMCVDVPTSLFANLSVKVGKRANLSFI